MSSSVVFGKKAKPLFIGKKDVPLFLGKRKLAPVFLGKREDPIFKGTGISSFGRNEDTSSTRDLPKSNEVSLAVISVLFPSICRHNTQA